MPPPVLPGEAPTNMRSMRRKREDSESRLISTVLKPAVLEDTLRNRVDVSLVFQSKAHTPE
ncbi:hypothetical protein HG1285_06200 [Hydrogenivirga sp. 128-5-R1-1]|nr:hypothetical protein HG1285_06200 [Hydrogenivirga sp. 128-5-R1-1]